MNLGCLHLGNGPRGYSDHTRGSGGMKWWGCGCRRGRLMGSRVFFFFLAGQQRDWFPLPDTFGEPWTSIDAAARLTNRSTKWGIPGGANSFSFLVEAPNGDALQSTASSDTLLQCHFVIWLPPSFLSSFILYSFFCVSTHWCIYL